MRLSKRVSNIAVSLTLEITAKAKRMKQEGISVVSFGAGEPDFNTPEYIINSAKHALDIGFTKYTPASGMMELKKAIVEKFKKDNGINYTPEQIVISSGAKSSLYHAIAALVDSGDEVIIPAPYWLTYPELVNLAEGKCVYVNTTFESEYKITPKQLKEAITEKTKLLILNSPSNPTGAIYTEEELRELAKVIEEAGIYVIADEIYEKLIYCGKKHFSIASINDYMFDHTVTVNGVSKSYSMTGWRIGYLGAPTDIAKAISSMQSHTTSNACSIAQYASCEALTSSESDKFIENMQRVFDERRKLIINELKNVEGIKYFEPQGAFYVYVDVSNYYGKEYDGKKITGSLLFADCALAKGVALIPGIAFGDDNCIRLSYAISNEDIVEGIKRIRECKRCK